ncbi:unnamed protein product [Gongylonema pulchrum]|uniref:Uncharacterized protein n=1 Tax=Gongylonema pulchrum TaxID=637853 RepID=A0A3P7MP10_9BILA|nr:unnamed protein product [Gongylonema pulchrum]
MVAVVSLYPVIFSNCSTVLVENHPNALESLINSFVGKQIPDDNTNSSEYGLAFKLLIFVNMGKHRRRQVAMSYQPLRQHRFPFLLTPITGTKVQPMVASAEAVVTGIQTHSPLPHPLTFESTKLRTPSPVSSEAHPCAGRSVASAIRRICLTSPLSALTLKKQISDLIYDAEIKQLIRERKTEHL